MKVSPASYVQEGWFRAAPDHATNHSIALGWTLAGGADVGAVKEAVGRLVARHDALRTVLRDQDGEVRQVVASVGESPLWDVDLSRSATAEHAFEEMVVQAAETPFTLTAGPVWRGGVARLPDGRVGLGMAIAHAVADGWSAALAGRELRRLYRRVLGGSTRGLQPVDVQFGEYAAGERALRDAAAESWWRSYLAGAPAADALRVGDGGESGAGFEMVTLRLPGVPAAVAAGLRLAMPPGDVTLTAVVCAAAAMSAAPYVEGDLVIGVLYANRDRSDVLRTFGPVFDYLPVRVDLSSVRRFGELVKAVRHEIEAGKQHRIPLGLIERVVHGGQGHGVFSVAVDFMPRRRGGDGVAMSSREQHAFDDVALDDVRIVHRGRRRFAVTAPVTYVVRDEADGGLAVEMYADIQAVGARGVSALSTGFSEALTAISRVGSARAR
jgi:pristinamycin I synthase 3 and 4